MNNPSIEIKMPADHDQTIKLILTILNSNES